MKIVIFGLAVSSSWGNGHATLWRGLCKALSARGHDVTFFEKNTYYYAQHRDLQEQKEWRLEIYEDWQSARPRIRRHMRDADVLIVTSYCPDAPHATEELLEYDCLRVFYDLDTPVTLFALSSGSSVPYIGTRGLRDFDLVFSFTGGAAITQLETTLGAVKAVPLYGSVDSDSHFPVSVERTSELSYLGTFAADRQDALDRLFLEPARRRAGITFNLGGAQYPADFAKPKNVLFAPHVPPSSHPAFYCSSWLTLNITRAPMAALGYCPSGRLFEAGACGVPVITDTWAGLDSFYEPGREILPVTTTEEVLEAIALPASEKARIGSKARERTLSEHTAAHRAREMEQALMSSRRAYVGNYSSRGRG